MEKFDVLKKLFFWVAAFLTAALGNLQVPLITLLVAMILDYFTAINAAENRGEKVKSRKSWEGIKPKIHMLALVLVGGLIDGLLAYAGDTLHVTLMIPLTWPFATVIALWLVFNEIISILENIIDSGVKIPKWLLPFVKNIHSKIDEEVENKIGKNQEIPEDEKNE